MAIIIYSVPAFFITESEVDIIGFVADVVDDDVCITCICCCFCLFIIYFKVLNLIKSARRTTITTFLREFVICLLFVCLFACFLCSFLDCLFIRLF